MSIPPGSLVAQYDLNSLTSYPGTGSTLFDISGNNADISLTNTGYLDFNSYNSLVFTKSPSSYGTYTGDLGLGTTTPIFTFFMWVKPNDVTNGVSYSWFISYGKESGAVGGAPMILPYFAASPNLVASFGSGKADINTGTALTNDQWVCLATTCDGTTYRLYKNGVQVGSALLSGAQIISPQSLALNYIVDNPGLGALDYELNLLNVYDSALSSGDILALYNETKTRFPIYSYDFSNSLTYSGSGDTVYDLSRNLNLPIVNGTTFAGSGVSKYFSFDGSNDYIGFESGITGVGNTFTIDMWLQSDNDSSIRAPFSSGTNGGGFTGPTIYLNDPSSGNVTGCFNFGVGNCDSTISLSTWTNFVYTGDGTTVKLYKDGSLADTASQGIGSWNTGAFLMGRNAGGSASFQGKIAILDIYDVALGSTEVSNNYSAQSPRFLPAPPTPALIASYDFSDPSCWPGSGNTVFDLTSEGNDLAITSTGFGGTGQSVYASFNGDTSYLYNGNFSSSGSTFSGDEFTLSLWHYYPNTQANQATMIMGGNGAFQSGIQIQVNGDDLNKITAAFGAVLNEDGQLIGNANTTNTWNMSTVTGDGTTLKLYQNGALIGSTSQTGQWDGPGFILGRPLGDSSQPSPESPGYRYDGNIALVEVYNYAIGSTTVSDLYTNQSTRFPAPTYAGNVGGRQFAQGFNG
jgi:hypothetical protein